MSLTPHHVKYYAHDLTRRAVTGMDRISMALFDAAVDLNPHQIEAALFALQSPLSKGVILADEVGLGKTIEAGIVLCQFWAERKRRLLVICPASLRKQWAMELEEKFNLPVLVLDARAYREAQRGGVTFGAGKKPEALLARLVDLCSEKDDLVGDFFLGSGTLGAVAQKTGRRWVGVKGAGFFQDVTLKRICNVLRGDTRGISDAVNWHGGGIVRYSLLESYEDALNNLETRRTDTQQLLLDAADAQGADGLKEQYILRYMLNVETRGSQSLLNVQAFTDPTAYKLKVKRPGSDESREVNVDLLETFNWLIGLTVRHIAAPKTFDAAFERDSEERLRLKGRLKQEADGPYWFRTVTGTTPDVRRTLIIWRKLTGQPERDNLVLDEWFTKQGYSARDSEFDLIYVNGGNNLENLKTPDDLWKVRLIEEDFHRLMFEIES